MPATSLDLWRLRGVHPKVHAAILTILQEMPMFVVQGVRTAKEQARLYAQGRTTPGSIVTYKNGITHKSNHQVDADGLGRAVDCAFLGGDPFSVKHDWDGYGKRVEALGLVWGGRFKMVDRPHAELASDLHVPSLLPREDAPAAAPK